MREEVLVTKDNFKKVQRQGKQTLRILLLLFLLFLMVYYILSYLLLENMLSMSMFQEARPPYLVYSIVEGSIWLIIWIQLWKYSKVGRVLFTIASLASLYFFKDVLALCSLSLSSLDLQLMRYLFIAMMIGKAIFALCITWRLFQDVSIRCIWTHYDLYVQEVKELDDHLEDDISSVVHEDVLAMYEEEETKLNHKAQRFLRRYVWKLLFLTYGLFLLLYLLLFYIQYIFPKELEGLQYVQRILLLSCLFTILIWTLPMITMFLHKRWTRILIPFAWLLEVTRFVLSFSELIHTFQTQRYGWITIIVMTSSEILRYGLLFRFSLSFYRNPFMKVYWEKQAAIIHQKNKQLHHKEKV